MGSCACGASTWLCDGISSQLTPIIRSPDSKRGFVQVVPRNIRPIDHVYAFRRKLGSGSGGEVHKVKHRVTGARRAVKTIQRSKATCIRREISILEMMSHTNILQLHETFEDGKCIHLVTELCRGGDLFDGIQSASRFTTGLTSVLSWQLLDAVRYMHGCGVCHRDLKPDNLMLMSRKGPPQESHLKVVDFGLARTFRKGDSFKTRAGTYLYVAPEVVNGYYDERCDLWSCGIIIYAMLSGSPPWEGEAEHEVLGEIEAGKIYFDDNVWEEISETPKELIRMLTQVKPDGRLSAEQSLLHKFIKKEPARLPLADSFLKILTHSHLKEPIQMIQEMCSLLHEEGISELPPDAVEVLRSSDVEFLLEALYAFLHGDLTDPVLHRLAMNS